jgi:uncharacterized protein (TIGR00730 family)
MSMYKSVAVFCGSNGGRDPIYIQHAKELGELLCDFGITLIYGGGNTGLMGAIADAVLEHGGEVIGVIPEVLTSIERQHTNISKLHIVNDMHTRKKMMYELCDAAIILPGGNGTLDEMFEMVTWNALSIHNKKIILLNTAGYYNNLIGHINTMQVSGFLHSDWREMLSIYETPDAIFRDWVSDKN